MNACRPLLFVILPSIFIFAHPALAQPCDDLSPGMIHHQERLYEYALIAEAAYGKKPKNSCAVSSTGSRIGMPEVEVHRLLPREVDTKWKLLFYEHWPSERLPKPDNMGRYLGDNSVTYITCTYDYPMPQFALTWTEFQRAEEEKVILHIAIHPVIPISMLAASIPLSKDEIGIVRLRRDPSSDGKSEELVAIQGTDFTRIPQIMTSMQHLLSKSCVYEMAAIVVAVVGGSKSASQISVVGHSLGGGAVQYIVQDHTRNSWRNPANRQNSNVIFGAYSFNSIGLDPSYASATELTYLSNYIVDGEVVSWLGENFGQTQIGTVIRYLPPSDWPEVGWLGVLEDVVQWDQPETIRRHRLPAIQQGICECINGRGSISTH